MDISEGEGAAKRSSVRALIAAVLAPVAVFYGYLFYMSRNLPLLDDYYAGLNFANQLLRQQGFRERLIYFAGAQHNEYKLFLGHALVWLELGLMGRVNFQVLSALGNVSFLVLGYVLWKMFMPGVELARRLALFVPVSLLLFQYQYVETLNWPLPGVQNLWVVASAIGSLYLLGQGNQAAFVGGLGFMVLGISASANGFLIVAAGGLMLLRQRRFGQLGVWVGTTALLGSVYAFHYNAMLRANPEHTLLKQLLHPQVGYVLGFLGAAGRYPVSYGAVVLGAGLCVYFGWMIWQGFLRDEPVVGYCLLFVLMTGVGVSGLRAEDGLAQSVSSRYRMYSDLLLIFGWFALVWRFRLAERVWLRRSRVYVGGVVASALFCVTMDAIGIRSLRIRDHDLVHGMTIYERSGGTQSPMYAEASNSKPTAAEAEHARQVLEESKKMGTYEPPAY